MPYIFLSPSPRKLVFGMQRYLNPNYMRYEEVFCPQFHARLVNRNLIQNFKCKISAQQIYNKI